MDITASRLTNHHLVNPLADIETAINYLGAVQAQDYYGAAWALSLRVGGISKNDVDTHYNDGKILRTHILRPTWHFVLPTDIRWMLELTRPRIAQTMAYYNRKLELNEAFFAKSHAIMANALRDGNYLTRKELTDELRQHGLSATGQRMGHIMLQAEMTGWFVAGHLGASSLPMR